MDLGEACIACFPIGYFITLTISEDIITLTLLGEKHGSHKYSYQITVVWFIFMRVGCLVVHCCLQLIRTFSDNAKGDSNCEHHQQPYLDQCRTHPQKKRERIANKQNLNNARQPNGGPVELIILSDLCPLFLWPWSYYQHLEPPSNTQLPFWKVRYWQSGNYSSGNPISLSPLCWCWSLLGLI